MDSVEDNRTSKESNLITRFIIMIWLIFFFMGFGMVYFKILLPRAKILSKREAEFKTCLSGEIFRYTITHKPPHYVHDFLEYAWKECDHYR